LTLDVNYFYAMTLLLVLLFALIGFALGRDRSLATLKGVFFAYGAADQSAVFIRDGLNFVLKLELGDEIIPYLQGAIFFLTVIALLCFYFDTVYRHTFASRLKGMLTGLLTGYFVSVFALEFLRELLAGWPEAQTAIFDFSYDLLGQEGLFVLTLNFFSEPEAAYTLLRKALVPDILISLLILYTRAFQGFARVLGTIWGAFVKWVSIRGGDNNNNNNND
jgi:hypothetical protein